MKKLIHCIIILSFIACFFYVLTSCSTTESDHPIKVIFETDLGNDIDDALALDMLYKYADQKKVDLLAVSTNKNNEYSARYISLMNRWYGYPSMPVGEVNNGVDSEGDSENYAQHVCGYSNNGGKIFEEGKHNFTESVSLYRKVLSKQADNSVVIVSVGFSTNLARLLDSPADEFSGLNGKKLVARKVKILSMMAGNFCQDPRTREYNIIKDIPAARKVFSEWPTPIVTSPFEVGDSILFPASSIENDFQWAEYHPLVLGYKNYLPMPYDRQTWDLTAVLYAIEDSEDYFSKSENGIITIDKDGYTLFNKRSDGNHVVLGVNSEQRKKIKARFIELITQPPKSFFKREK